MSDFRRMYLPYCLRELSKNKWLILNRDYAHIGTFQKSNLDGFAINLKISDKNKAKLSINENFDSDIYLYDDKTNPLLSEVNMANYMNKLKILAKMEIL